MMKKTFCFICLIIICAVQAGYGTAPKKDADTERERRINSEKKMDYIMERAAEDISANTTLWAEMKQESDGVTGLGWRIVLGKKIPSQPLAVIEVLAFTGEDPTLICPPPFMEGTELYEIEEWMNQGIKVLDSFVLKDAAKDKLRKLCLDSIKESLRNKDSWK